MTNKLEHKLKHKIYRTDTQNNIFELSQAGRTQTNNTRNIKLVNFQKSVGIVNPFTPGNHTHSKNLTKIPISHIARIIK